MDAYDLGPAALRAAPRWAARALAALLAAGMWANAGWATGLVDGLVEHRTSAVVERLQRFTEQIVPTATERTPAPPKAG